MTLRERIERGERRHVHLAVEYRRRRGEVEVYQPVEQRPEWLVRASFRKDLTEVEA